MSDVICAHADVPRETISEKLRSIARGEWSSVHNGKKITVIGIMIPSEMVDELCDEVDAAIKARMSGVK